MTTKIEAIRRVSAYRTTDDKIHDSRDAAKRHQAKLDLIDWLGSASRWTRVEGTTAAELADELIAGGDALVVLLIAARKGL